MRALPLCLLLLAACATEPAERPAADPVPATEAAATEAEAFAPFFEHFRDDPAFQRERLADDFSYRYLDYNPDSMEMEEVEADDWAPIVLRWEGMEAVEERFDGAPTPDAIDPTADAVTFEIAGLDNGVHVAYDFVRRDGRWLLRSVVDSSM